MKPSVVIKSNLASLLSLMGVISWRMGKISGQDLLLLTYHRIIPRCEGQEKIQEGMYVQPGTFEAHLRLLKEHFNVVSLSTLASALIRKSFKPLGNDKSTCAITFDDGWKDFYDYAFPILKKYRIPATVFLPTGYIGTNNWFWTDRLAYLFFQLGKFRFSNSGRRLSIASPLPPQLNKLTGSRGPKLETAISLLKRYHNDKIQEIISVIANNWGLDPNPPGRAFLSWDEVRDLARSGLIDFGSHTSSHRILTLLTEKEVCEELKKPLECLIYEKVVDRSFIPFSYPNGENNGNIAQMVRDAGYNLAVTTETGWNNPCSDPYQLRRISIHEDMTSSNAMLRCKILGLL